MLYTPEDNHNCLLFISIIYAEYSNIFQNEICLYIPINYYSFDGTIASKILHIDLNINRNIHFLSQEDHLL